MSALDDLPPGVAPMSAGCLLLARFHAMLKAQLPADRTARLGVLGVMFGMVEQTARADEPLMEEVAIEAEVERLMAELKARLDVTDLGVTS